MEKYPDLVERFIENVNAFPGKPALIYPAGFSAPGVVKYSTISYYGLHELSNRYALGFQETGLRSGMRILCMVPPGLEFIAITLSLFKLGAVPVFIDPGMARRTLLKCIGETGVEAMVGNTLAHALRKIYPSYFKGIKLLYNSGYAWLTGGSSLQKIKHQDSGNIERVTPEANAPFLVAFTTGSTGVPKGVIYLQRTLNAQINAIRNDLKLSEHDVVLEAFIPFAIRDIAIGTTCIIPKMDPAKPSEVNPRHVVSAIQAFNASYSFGSPSFWTRVLAYCHQNGIALPSLKHIMLAGAPITPGLIRELKSLLAPGAEVHTPYGATEALPIASISATDILNVTERKTNIGGGICVGKALTGVEIKVIKIYDGPISDWSSSLEVNANEIGEIVVKGDVVTSSYLKRPDETILNKIPDGDSFWHRMGDVGYLDHDQKLWYCGRKDHRVMMNDRVLFTIPCEAIFNLHEDIKQSALIGLGPKGNQRPVMVIEPYAEKMPHNAHSKKEFVEKLLSIAGRQAVTECIGDFLFHPNLPMDYRHNAKILRKELAEWAARKTR